MYIYTYMYIYTLLSHTHNAHTFLYNTHNAPHILLSHTQYATHSSTTHTMPHIL